MKKLYSIAAGLLLATASLNAQIAAAPLLPCSTFENPAPAGNWMTSFCAAVYGAINPLDGSQAVTLYDQAGGSWYTNTVDYNNLGQLHLGRCLCFDYNLVNDGGSGVPFFPTIYLSDGINTIAFVSSTAVTPGSGWIRVCAPIEHCVAGGALPSNASGSWVIITGSTCTDFNNVLDNVTSVGFPTDINSCPCEEMQIDNVCVTNCNNCKSKFRLDVSFNSNGTADANLVLDAVDASSTYVIDWGDGSPVTPYGTPHTYITPTTYKVCVSQYIKDVLICRTCMMFCYGRQETVDAGGNGGGDQGGRVAKKNPTALIRTMNDSKFNTEGYMVFPNPTKDYAEVQFSLPEKAQASVRVTDLFGRVVTETTGSYDRGSHKIILNTEKLATGVYNVEINVAGQVSTQKLSITK